jgi:HSP20 family protein
MEGQPMRPAPSLKPGISGAVSARLRQTVESNTLVIEVALPGVEPRDDIEVTIGGGWLHVYAEQRVAWSPPGVRVPGAGVFAASVPLPPGVVEGAVQALYRAGTLEIRIPFDPTTPAQTTVPVEVA